MTPAAARLYDVLAKERAAARAADLDALAAIQSEKRDALDALASESIPSVDRSELARAADANVRLLAHLAACLRAFSGAEARTTYTTTGASAAPPPETTARLDMTVNSLLNVGKNGLAAASFGVDVASQNASNVATPGYTRRTAQIVPLEGPPVPGNGAIAKGATRVIDPFVERRLLGATSSSDGAAAAAQALAPIDDVVSTGPGSIADALDALRTATADLAARPSDSAVRATFLARPDALATAFRGAAEKLSTARSDANARIKDGVSQVDARLTQIASLGRQIALAQSGGQEASDLRDRRDALVREVSSQVPLTVIESASGQLTLLLNGTHMLVGPEGQVVPLGTATDPATGDVTITTVEAGKTIDVTSELHTGRIGGLIGARDGGITTAQEQLDQLAADVSGAYNGVHTTGYGLDGGTGRNLFTPAASVTGAAAAMTLSSDVAGQPDKVAAAGSPGLPGDSAGARALVDLASAPVATGGVTLDEAFSAMIVTGGTTVRSANDAATYASDALAQVQALRDSVSGVSSDDEMIALQRYQRAYEASLKVVQTADQMLQELLALKR